MSYKASAYHERCNNRRKGALQSNAVYFERLNLDLYIMRVNARYH